MPDIAKPEDLGSYVADLERRIRLLESAPKLQDSSVTNGTLTVKDASVPPVIKTQFGLLSDGSYGLAVTNSTGNLVNVNNTLFPKYGIFTGTQNRSNTSWDLLPSGPSITATIGESGIAVVSVYADIGLNQNNQTGYVGFYNATSGYLLSGWLSITSPAGTFIAGTAGKATYLTGLPAGVNTFAAAAFVSAGNVNFSNVTIIVQPF